ncbi:MAG TPA: PSD1 and planctomycete cytochrome C domain-containing protein [Gemmataceae bacterium]|jgi:cytochrome c553|nr:PSD1 and planctomycete cytochrome C domain-containing protein [Gemmataceae bacterium]
MSRSRFGDEGLAARRSRSWTARYPRPQPFRARLRLAANHLALAIVALFAGSAAAQDIDFAHDIVPILKARCIECHSNGKYKGAVSFDTRTDAVKKAIVPGKAAGSKLIERVKSTDADERMPPKGPPLSAVQIAKLAKWIDQGAKWEDGFTFKKSTYVAPLKLRPVTIPPAHGNVTHPIDRILEVYHRQHKVEPPAAADPAVFLRRATLDLIGQLPLPAEMLANQDRAEIVGRLLAEKRAYADHWLTFWNDLLRNDYRGTGYIDGGRKQISAWLYKSLSDNKPYDVFVRDLLNPKPEAEGFIYGIRWRGRINASQVTELQFSQNVAQVFFGANIKCASCHDSFINAWKLKDAYGLAAIIADHPLELYRCDKATGVKATPKFLWPELGDIDPKLPKKERLKRLADLVTHPDNGRFSRTIVNRIWQRLFGRGIVHPVDMMENQPWSEDLLDYLAGYLALHKYDLKQLLAHICTSNAYAAQTSLRDKEPTGDDYVFRGPQVRRMTAEQFVDAIRQITHETGGGRAAPFEPTPFDGPAPRRFMRASLQDANLMMRSLGRPNREQVVTTRPEMLTTLEALDLCNGPILTEMLRQGASRVLSQKREGKGADPIVSELYLDALSRRPTDGELAAARELIGSPVGVDGLSDFLWTLVMLPEFQHVR